MARVSATSCALAACCLLGAVLLGTASAWQPKASSTSPTHALPDNDKSAAGRTFHSGSSPFVPNLGQWDHPARFVHRNGPMTMFLEDRAWTLDLSEPSKERKGRSRPALVPPYNAPRPTETRRGVALRMTFEGRAHVPDAVGESRLRGVHNYFLGNDPGLWRTHVPLYASVLYREMYPGVDVRVREVEGHPEYDLLLEPGANPTRISVRVEGADDLRLASDGSLVVETAVGPLTQPVPRTWETGPQGERKEVPCRYAILDRHRFGFDVAGWTGVLPLTIDPGLLWSTLLGGSRGDACEGVFVEASGLVTVAGTTTSANFPATPGAYPGIQQGVAATITQLDPSKAGSAQLVYSTFLGGDSEDVCKDVFVDANGVVTFFGRTFSSNFPTTPGAFRTTRGGQTDGLVGRLDPRLAGSAQLVWSTLLGGGRWDDPRDFFVDSSGLVTVVGDTLSRNFPVTPGAYDTTFNGSADAFVSKLDPGKTGSAQLVYSTLLGALSDDVVWGVSVDANNVVTLGGSTSSPGFPSTPDAFDPSFNGGGGDAFVSRLDPSLIGSAQLVYSTFFGGNGDDEARGMSVDARGVVTISGTTTTLVLPTTPGAYQSMGRGGLGDGFVSRLDLGKTGSAQLVYSTLLGGTGQDTVGGSPSVDASGVVTVTGFTTSSDFPTTPGAFDTTHNGGRNDLFVSRLDSNRTGSAQLIYSTLLGGDGDDRHLGSHSLAPDGTVTVPGYTLSSNFPTTPSAWGPSSLGGTDGFVTQLDALPTGVSTYGTSSPGCKGTLAVSVSSWPQAGNAAFSTLCSNAPTNAPGVLLLGASSLSTPFSLLGVDLWVNPAAPWFLAPPTTSNQVGAADFPLPLPAGTAGSQFFAQFAWLGPGSPAPCPPTGFSASNALDITIQP